MNEDLKKLMTLVSQFTLLALAGYVVIRAFGLDVDSTPKKTENTSPVGSGSAPLSYNQTRL